MPSSAWRFLADFSSVPSFKNCLIFWALQAHPCFTNKSCFISHERSHSPPCPPCSLYKAHTCPPPLHPQPCHPTPLSPLVTKQMKSTQQWNCSSLSSSTAPAAPVLNLTLRPLTRALCLHTPHFSVHQAISDESLYLALRQFSPQVFI